LNTQLATELHERAARSARALAIFSLGPLTILGGVVWAIVQPYRLTLLHPHGQGFWWLVAEPPLYVVGVGIAFALLVAPGLLEDIEAEEGR
jgi:cytochrome bd-type quinol oxidase subunit 2